MASDALTSDFRSPDLGSYPIRKKALLGVPCPVKLLGEFVDIALKSNFFINTRIVLDMKSKDLIYKR